METKVIKETKGKLQVEVLGADHALMNLVRSKLTEDKGVEFATYSKPHPLLEGFVLTVKGKDPRASVKSALAGVKKEAEEAKAAFKKAK